MKSTEIVFQDHAMLRRGLDILDGIVRKLEQGERIEIADAATVLKFIRLFGLEYHQSMEEQVLFPALLRGALHESRISDLLFEHEEERSLVTAIEDALTTKKGMEFVRRSRGFSVLMRNHLNREDSVLRNFAEGWLSSEQDEAIVALFVQKRLPPDTYLNFSRLEWKYGTRPHTEKVVSDREFVRAAKRG